MKKLLGLGALSLGAALLLGLLDRETESLGHLLSTPGNLAGLAFWTIVFFAVGLSGWLFFRQIRHLR